MANLPSAQIPKDELCAVFSRLPSQILVNLDSSELDWKIWRVDFTRAFRLHKDRKDPKDLVRCERQLFEKLKALDGNEVAAKTKGYLAKDEAKAVMARRDKILAYFQKLISEKGESEVLY